MSKKMLFPKLLFSFALSIVFATTSCNHSKEIAPLSEVTKTSVSRNDKNTSDLYRVASENTHLRNVVRTILQISANFRSLSANYSTQQIDDGMALAYEALANGSTTNPLSFVSYDTNLYEAQATYLSQEMALFQNEVPAFQEADASLKMSIINKVISDVISETPNDPIYIVNGYLECVADATGRYFGTVVDCKTNGCVARATFVLALEVSYCSRLN